MTTTDIDTTDAGSEPPEGQGASGTGAELVPAGSGGGRAVVAHTALLEPGENPRAEAVRTRILLPLLLPIVSAAALFFYVINLSRALLAGGEWGSLVIASIITLSILAAAAWISAHPKMSTGSLAIMLGVLLILIAAAGLTSLGPSENKEAGKTASGGYKQPAGPAVATVEVQALATLKFNATNFDTQAGINEIKYVLGGGSHTLVFEDKTFAGFELAVGGQKTESTGKVDLKPGKYVIYCTIPGHRAAGMEATITVQ